MSELFANHVYPHGQEVEYPPDKDGYILNYVPCYSFIAGIVVLFES